MQELDFVSMLTLGLGALIMLVTAYKILRHSFGLILWMLIGAFGLFLLNSGMERSDIRLVEPLLKKLEEYVPLDLLKDGMEKIEDLKKT